ncbi:hypothetical protein PFISCL1PPCAC_29029, partial [Pristionchus fissidentatus]
LPVSSCGQTHTPVGMVTVREKQSHEHPQPKFGLAPSRQKQPALVPFVTPVAGYGLVPMVGPSLRMGKPGAAVTPVPVPPGITGIGLASPGQLHWYCALAGPFILIMMHWQAWLGGTVWVTGGSYP